jgi:hypothetical protein
MQEILKATQAEAEQSLSIATETRHLTEEMTKILHAAQQGTEASCQLAAQSQRLTEEMMKDSVAMKTVKSFFHSAPIYDSPAVPCSLAFAPCCRLPS